MLEKISQENFVSKLKQGVETNIAAASNLFSMAVIRPTVAGIPMVARQDLLSVFAGKAFFKFEAGQGLKVRADVDRASIDDELASSYFLFDTSIESSLVKYINIL